MTPTRSSLQRTGILGEAAADGTTLGSVSAERLADIARRVVSFPWKDEAPLPDSALAAPIGDPSLFDFSVTRRAAVGVQVAGGGGGRGGLFVGLCGDALIEPFWPEGLGIVRGFFSALDLAASVKVWAESSDEGAAENCFEAAYRQLKSLA